MKTVKAVKTTKKANTMKKVNPSFTVDLVGVQNTRDVYSRFAAAKINAGIMPTDNELMCVITSVVEDIEAFAICEFAKQLKAKQPAKEGFFKRLWRGLKYAFGSKNTGIVVL